MLLDPFTVIAQIVNFAILAVALKHFLYDRVIDAMDRREASIASRLSEADEREEAARNEAEQLARERARLDHDRRGLIEEARAEAAAHRQELLERARAEVNDDRLRWERGLRAEQQEFRRDLRRRTTHEVMELARRALSDLAGARLESVVLDRALDHLAHSNEARDALLVSAGSGAELTVRTAFEIADADRRHVTERLRTLGLPSERRVRFECDPDLVLGVELYGGGSAASWNATDFVDQLVAAVEELADHVEHAGDED